MILEQLPEGQSLPIQLLLEAGPDETKVRDYCQARQIWVLKEARVIGVAVLLPVTDRPLLAAEIKNIAIQPDRQGRRLEACRHKEWPGLNQNPSNSIP